MISISQFRKLFPACPAPKASLYLPLLVAAMVESKITTRKRAASFCAQVGHESLDFKYMEEIASGEAYERRRDLGNVRPGDGKRYKGRGPLQVTGRLNYTRCGIALNLPLADHPELLSIPANGFRASAWFWNSNKLNVYADALSGLGDSVDLARFDKITRRVNGGLNGQADRRERYVRALSVLTDAQFAASTPSSVAPVSTVPEVSTPAAVSSKPADGDSAQAQATPAPATQGDSASPEASLLDEIPVNEQTKAVGMNVAKRLGVKLGVGLSALWTSGLGGRVLVVALCIGLLILAYTERKALTALALRLLKKFGGKK